MIKIFKPIIQYLKRSSELRKKQELLLKIEAIDRMYNVREKDNCLYIICNGAAIRKIENNETAGEIIESIKTTRQTSKKYANLEEHGQQD